MNNYTIGTVCKLKNSDIKIVIIGYNGSNASNPSYIFNYIGCIYPTGYTDSNKLCYFNNEHIDKIIFEGYMENNDNKSVDIIQPIKVLDPIPIDNSKNVESNEISNSIPEESQNQNSNVEKKGNYIFDENGILIAVE